MAIANSDGSIVIGIKLATHSIEKGLRDFKNKIKSSTKQENYFDVLKEKIFIARDALEEYKKEYAKLVAVGKQDSKEGVAFQKLIKATESELKELTTASSVLGKKATKSFADMSKGLKNFGKRIAGIVKSALIFSVLYKVMQAVVKMFQNILMSDEEFRQDWEELKAAFYTAAYPIINLIVPAIKWIVQQVRDWAVSIGKVAAALQGMSYSELVDQAKASKEAADNYADMEKSSKKTADNVKKQLASFDDIQILSSGNEEEQGASGAGFKGLGQYDTSGEKAMLEDLMTAIGGALMAVGLILLFNGQIAWGLGFIIAGAGLLTVTQASVSQEGVGIDVQNALTTALLIAGVAAIVIGIILCMCQQYVKGIALIALGAATVVGDIAINWDSIKDMLSDEKVATWVAIGGILAVVLGILLCFAQQWLPGIGLIALGAGALGVDIAVNWDAISTAIKDFVVENAGIIALISAGLLIIGILVCFVNLPLGIALIAAGAVGLVTVTALNWDAIVDWVKGAWEAVKSFWNTYIAPVFTAEWWINLGKTCINGLIAGFEGGINGIIWAFESMINWIVDGLNKISFEFPDWVPAIGGKTFGMNIPRASFGRVSIPRLAQGTVVPPNKRFIAELGDNTKEHEIVSPLSTIEQAVENVLSRQGGATREEHYYLDETQVMSVIYRLVKGGERISGESLVEGGAY